MKISNKSEDDYCRHFSTSLQAHPSISGHPNFDAFVRKIGGKTASMASQVAAEKAQAIEGWNYGWEQRQKYASAAVSNLSSTLDVMGSTEQAYWLPPLETIAMVLDSSPEEIADAVEGWAEVTSAIAAVIEMRENLPKPKHRPKKSESIQGAVFWLAQEWERFFMRPPKGGDGAPFTTVVQTYFELRPWGGKPPSHPNIAEAIRAYQSAKEE